MILIIILVVALILYFRLKKNNYHLTYNNITYLQGEVGSGKTTMLTYLALKERKIRLRHNFFSRILSHIPLIKKLVKFKNPCIYSTYPIWINKKVGFSYVIDRTVLSWETRIKEGAIVVLDEMEMVFPSEAKKTEAVYSFGTAFIRHGANALIFASSQSLNEVNISFRRRVNSVYMLNNCKRGLFFSSVEVHKAIASEEFTNVFVDNNDVSKNILKFRLKNGHFDSRYASNLYALPQKKIELLASDFNELLNAQGLKNGDKWVALKWQFNS